MMVLAGRGHTMIHYWAGKLPGSVGHIHCPPKPLSLYPWMPYALDCGVYAAAMNGRKWDEAGFIALCNQTVIASQKPRWIVVPDVYKDAEATLRQWREWEPRLRRYNVPLAFVCQNGIQPERIPKSADVLFIGGTDEWRYPLLPMFTSLGKPVHVGRVNGDRLWQCYKAGIASVDGSGWFRGDQQQLAKLEAFLRAMAGEIEPPRLNQLDMFGKPERSFYKRLEQDMRRNNPIQQRIPQNIQREHLLQAIACWTGTPKVHQSTRYVVELNGQVYPPKLLISRANIFANHCFLHPKQFSGGDEANNFLERRGFKVRLRQKSDSLEAL